jgi:hypothetical protein
MLAPCSDSCNFSDDDFMIELLLMIMVCTDSNVIILLTGVFCDKPCNNADGSSELWFGPDAWVPGYFSLVNKNADGSTCLAESIPELTQAAAIQFELRASYLSICGGKFNITRSVRTLLG